MGWSALKGKTWRLLVLAIMIACMFLVILDPA